MVRLRTNRWYGLDGQRRLSRQVSSQALGTRYVISLCLLLVLVIVLMQTVADPKHVQRAFSSLGVPLAENSSLNPSAPAPGAAASNHSQTSQSAAPLPQTDEKWAATCRDLIPRVLDQHSIEHINLIAQHWFAGQPTAASDQAAARKKILQLREQTVQTLANLKLQLEAHASSASQTDPDKQDGVALSQWGASFSRFDTQWERLLSGLANPQSVERSNFDTTFHASLQQYLDERLTGALRDGQAWHASEFVAFWRTLQRARELSNATDSSITPLVNTYQLVADSTYYRGKPIGFRGTVRRIEKIERTNPAFGFASGYWQMWLRGDDNTNQPVTVYSPDPTLASLAGEDQADANAGAEIELSAIVSKRLAYSSQAGIEVAPTLFAIRIAPVKSDAASSSSPLLIAENWRGTGLTAIAALLIAAAIFFSFVRHRKRRSGPSRKRVDSHPTIVSLCLAIYSCGPCDLLAQDISNKSGVAEVKVPWAEPDPQVVALQLLDRRLTEAMKGDALEQISRFLSGDAAGEFPNALLRILHSATQIGWQRLATFDPKTQFANGALSLAEYQGFVRLAAVEPLTSSQLGWFGDPSNDRVYRVVLELEESRTPTEVKKSTANESVQPGTQAREMLTVFCRSVPHLWLSSVQLRQPATVRGIALKAVGHAQAATPSEPRGLPACLITDQPIWRLPSGTLASDLQPTLDADHFALGLAGWNLSWIDLLAQKNQNSLSVEEQPAFYSMISTSRILANRSSAAMADSITPVKAFQQQKESIAKIVRWRVRLVKGAVVQVSTDEARRILGAEQYFQLDGFVDLGNQKVKYSPRSKDPQANQVTVEFDGEFPITLVSSNLPAGFGPADALRSGSQAWDIGKYALAEGIFYRLWSYHSERLSTANSEAAQVAPLVVLTSLTLSSPAFERLGSDSVWVSYALAAAIIGCLLIIWYSVLSQRKRTGAIRS